MHACIHPYTYKHMYTHTWQLILFFFLLLEVVNAIQKKTATPKLKQNPKISSRTDQLIHNTNYTK